MFWIWFITTLIILITITWCLSHDYYQGLIIIPPLIFVALFSSSVIAYANKPHEPLSYNIPYCPQDNLVYYEKQDSFFYNTTDIVNEFHTHGWSNVTVFSRTSGGIFGGTEQFVSGDCKL